MPKQKQHPIVDATDGIKVQCCKEHRKSEMLDNMDILEISELKWTRMGEFNSVDH